MLKRLGLTLLLAIALAPPAAAGPWTPERGHGQVIVTFGAYSTRESFTQQGDRSEFGFDGKFRKLEINPYFELGVTDRLTFIANTFVIRSEFSNTFGAQKNSGLGDSTIGLRYRLTDTNRPVIIAMQGGVKLPTAGSGQPNLGNQQVDVDGRLVVGGSLGKSSRPPFWTVEGGFRYRAEGPADELKFEGTLGAYVLPRLMLLGQVTATKGLKNNDQVLAGLDPTLSPDYDLTRAQGSVVVSVAARSRIQAGAFIHAAGRNTGAGSGFLVSFWQTF
jgi:protein XagA